MSEGADILMELLRWGRLLYEQFNSSTEKHVPASPESSRPESSTSSSQSGRIILLGCGGVGKSTLARLLSGDYRLLIDDPGHYEESINVEKFKLASGEEVELIVLPGQKHRRSVTWKEVFDQVACGEVRGIIQVSAFGYHSLGAISYKSLQLFSDSNHRKPAFLKAYLESCQREEVELLKEIQPAILDCPRPIWLLSLVTKQDLWWKKRQNVEEWYFRGAYAEALSKIMEKSTFRHELAFASLGIRNLRTGDGELLFKNAEGYDQAEQIASVRRLIDALESLWKWEREQ